MKRLVLFRNTLVVSLFAVGSTCTLPAEEQWTQSSFSAGLLSAYVSEGREFFNASPAFEGVASVTWDAWSFEVANITAFDNDGVEWSAALTWERPLGQGILAVGVGHIRDTFEGATEFESEVGAAFAWPVTDRLEAFVEGTYAFRCEGYYGTAGFNYKVPTSDTYELVVTSGLSWNDGYYESAGRCGVDVALLGLELTVPLTTRWSVGAFVTQAFSLRGLDLDGGRDVTFGGLSFAADF